MALDATQKAQLVRILGVTPLQLDTQIEWLGTGFTSTHELAVEEEIERWEGFKTDFTNIHPNLKNFGAEIKYNDQKNDVRKNIAYLMERPDWANNGNGARLQRS